MATPEGVVFADILAKGETNPLLNCMLKIRIYYDLSTRNNHQAAFDCTRSLMERNRPSGLITAIHGGLIAEAAGKRFTDPGVPAGREEAMSLALKPD